MKIKKIMATVVICAFVSMAARQGIATEDLSTGVVWREDVIMALGQGVAPDGLGGSPGGKLSAKRAAMVDLQRNLLEFTMGVKIQSSTTMKDLMVNDLVKSSVQGLVKGVRVIKSDWDGQIYSLWGSLPLAELRGAAVHGLPSIVPKKVPPYSGEGYDSLVLDLEDQPFSPSMVISVKTRSGREIYGAAFVDRDSFIKKGMFHYDQSIGSGSIAWAASDKALLVAGEIDPDDGESIIIPDLAAELIEKNGFDFRIPCEVKIITKTAAVRSEERGLLCIAAIPGTP